jgi:hypothetical protein
VELPRAALQIVFFALAINLDKKAVPYPDRSGASLIHKFCNDIRNSAFMLLVVLHGSFSGTIAAATPVTSAKSLQSPAAQPGDRSKQRKNSIIAAVGIRAQTIRDSLLSVLAYTGSACNYSLQWQYRGETFVHWSAIDYAQGYLTSSISQRVTYRQKV